jgi:hypothetical protein
LQPCASTGAAAAIKVDRAAAETWRFDGNPGNAGHFGAMAGGPEGGSRMHIYPEMEAAMRSDDVDRYVALMGETFQYVRHKSGDTLDRRQMADLLRKVWSGGNRTIEDLRCIYENDDILVVHTRLAFANGAREGAMIVSLKRDGKIARIETGVSDLT